MMRNKIKIKKIDYLPARQVTFSKRRRGLFKKAAELSVLCESEVAVVIFSATGKLFHYSSSSTKDVIERYNADINGVEKSNNQEIELQLENENHIKLSKELEEKSRQLRQMKGEDLEGLNLDELLKLEQVVEASLGRVMETKEELIKSEIMALERKGAELVEANNQLRQTMVMLSGGNTGPALMDPERLNNNIEGGGEEEGMSAESAISTTCNSAVSLSLEDDSSDEPPAVAALYLSSSLSFSGQTKTSDRAETPTKLENENHIKLSKELEEKSRQLRQMKGEDLQGLNMDELLKLEQLVEASLGRVIETKEELIMSEIMALEKKGAELVEANNQLRQKMAMLSGGNTGPAFVEPETLITNVGGGGEEDGMSSESAIIATSTSCNSAQSLSLEDDCSDVTLSLKLG
ncbi:PREDICTED: MADS-box [Prunus dulcis]|uniref:PREDICTED: MADS-box n=1 Tax=Prunus dulcis TaxID=3755 RepID=A0A5E4EMY4_PRUDU|nr:PREDICTED: MADS-box [Prunus dulcis]